MSKYVKFLKELLTNRNDLEKALSVVPNEQFLASMMKILPTKMKDQWILTLPCEFGNSTKTHALADSRASINLMSYLFHKKLDFSYLEANKDGDSYGQSLYHLS